MSTKPSTAVVQGREDRLISSTNWVTKPSAGQTLQDFHADSRWLVRCLRGQSRSLNNLLIRERKGILSVWLTL